MIYLDNAATSGHKPEMVVRAVLNSLRCHSANPGRSGHKLSEAAAEAVFRCRNEVANFFGANDPSSVCFCYNCTHAINTVIKGNLKRGDHVIISSLEHNAVLRPVFDLSEDEGVYFDIAEVFDDDELTVKGIAALIKPETKLVFVTAASNVTGKLLPIKEIGELCKESQILFGVDAAQGAGVIDIDVLRDNIDYLCVAPHKGFYSPMGLGVLIASKPIERVIISGGTGSNSFESFQPTVFPERIESGTVALPAIEGLEAGVRYVRKLGRENIYRHEITLCQFLYNTLSSLGVELLSEPPRLSKTVPIVLFNVNNKFSEEVSAYLNKQGIAVRGGLHCAPLAHLSLGTIDRGAVRVSPSALNSFYDINKLIFYVKRLI